MSTTLESGAIATAENEATPTDCVGDLHGGWGFDPAAGRRRCAQCQVARDLGVGRSTVARASTSDRPSKYDRAAVLTSFTPFEPLVRALLTDHPDLDDPDPAHRGPAAGDVGVAGAAGSAADLSHVEVRLSADTPISLLADVTLPG